MNISNAKIFHTWNNPFQYDNGRMWNGNLLLNEGVPFMVAQGHEEPFAQALSLSKSLTHALVGQDADPDIVTEKDLFLLKVSCNSDIIKNAIVACWNNARAEVCANTSNEVALRNSVRHFWYETGGGIGIFISWGESESNNQVIFYGSNTVCWELSKLGWEGEFTKPQTVVVNPTEALFTLEGNLLINTAEGIPFYFSPSLGAVIRTTTSSEWEWALREWGKTPQEVDMFPIEVPSRDIN